jgi:hypothetical protein
LHHIVQSNIIIFWVLAGLGCLALVWPAGALAAGRAGLAAGRLWTAHSQDMIKEKLQKAEELGMESFPRSLQAYTNVLPNKLRVIFFLSSTTTILLLLMGGVV